MKERPILFSAPMVRAILDGRKTQTRRIVKNPDSAISGCDISALIDQSSVIESHCPYGKVGDQLWVREKFQPLWAEGFDWDSEKKPDYKIGFGYDISYPATDGIVEWIDGDDNITDRCRPSIHMPRWASRIQLEITGVRVERLNDISEADAAAEGMIFTDYGLTCFHQGAAGDVGNCPAPESHHQKRPGWSWKPTTHQDQCYHTAKYAFGNLWESINGAGSWEANPWVWVIEFKRVEK